MSVLVEDSPANRRFEILVDGALAGFMTYQPGPEAVVLMHTEIVPAFRDRGLGEALVRGALDQLEQRGDRVVVQCPFVTAYIRRHPEYGSLLAH